MSRYAFQILLLCIATVPLAAQLAPTESPLRDLRAAERLLEQRDYHGVLDRWATAHAQRSDASWTTALQLRRATLERELRMWNISAMHVDGVLRDHPAYTIETAAWLEKGFSGLQRDDHGWARYCFNTAIEIAEANPGRLTHEAAGTAYFWIGISHATEPGRADYRLATQALSECVKRYPTAERADDALFAVGQIDESMGRYDDALYQYDRIEAEYADGAYRLPAQIRAAQCLLLTGRATESLEKSTATLHQIDSLLAATRSNENRETLVARDECNLNRGSAALGLERYAEAEESFLQLAYNSTGTLRREGTLGLADTYLAAGRADSALALYTRLRSERTDDAVGRVARIRVGVAMRALNSGSGAVDLLAGIASDSTDVMRDEALLEVGRIHYGDANYNAAIEALTESITATSRSRIRNEASILLGLSLFALDRIDEAAVVLDTTDAVVHAQAAGTPAAVPTDAHNELRLLAAISLIHADRAGDAIPKLNNLVLNAAGYARTDEALYWLGEAYYRSGLLQAASESFETLIERYPQSPRVEAALYTSGWASFRRGACRQAEETFAQLVKAFPLSRHTAEAELRRGDCFYLVGDYQQAIVHYQRAGKIDSTSSIGRHALYQMSAALYNVERYTDALAALEAYRTIYPNAAELPDVLYRQAETEFRMRDHAAAIETLYSLIRTYDTSRLVPRTYYTLGRAYEAAGNQTAALAAHSIVASDYAGSTLADDADAEFDRLEHAIRRRADASEPADLVESGGLNNERGAIYNQARRHADARAEYRRAIDRSTDENIGGSAMLGLLRTSIDAGQTRDGIDTLRVLLPRFAESTVVPTGMLAIAGDLLARGDSANGLELLELVRSTFPDLEESWNATILAATIHALAGDADTARVMLMEQVAHAAESQRGVRLALGLAELDMATGNFDEAFARLERLSKRSDDVGAEALYRLGRCYAMQGRFEEAAVTFAEVIDRYLNKSRWNGRARYSLGESYEQMGLTDRAREIYQEIVNTNGSDEVRDAARTRLDYLSDL